MAPLDIDAHVMRPPGFLTPTLGEQSEGITAPDNPLVCVDVDKDKRRGGDVTCRGAQRP
jgi:hypothetical protein